MPGKTYNSDYNQRPEFLDEDSEVAIDDDNVGSIRRGVTYTWELERGKEMIKCNRKG